MPGYLRIFEDFGTVAMSFLAEYGETLAFQGSQTIMIRRSNRDFLGGDSPTDSQISNNIHNLQLLIFMRGPL